VADPLREVLSDEVPEIRAEAIRALESMGDRGAIPDIENLLADKDYRLQEQARRSLKVLNKKVTGCANAGIGPPISLWGS